MCRLLGYVGDSPLSAEDALGPDQFAAFTGLSRVHRDGWGMAWRTPGGIAVATSPRTAAEDPRFHELAATPLSDAGVVHLRWATDGLLVGPENTHPFTAQGLALAHNGSIQPVPALEALLSDRARAALQGTTDSERYFQFVLDRINASGDEAEGLHDAIRRLATAFPRASLNALVLSSTALYCVHVNSLAQPPLADLREVFGSDERMPAGHATAYFALSYRSDDRGVRVASTGLSEPGWTPLPQNAILTIDLATKAIEIMRLSLPDHGTVRA